MKTKNLNDWAVALVVVACSAVLLVALAIALQGSNLIRPGRTLRVNFSDATGIQVASKVKYAGAPVGRVHSLRILTEQERAEFPDRRSAVQVVLALEPDAPQLPADVTASIAADTLLSDKFVLLSGGAPGSGTLPNGALIWGIPPTTFDELARTAGSAVEGLQGAFGSGEEGLSSLVNSLRALLEETSEVVEEARALVGNGNSLVADARGMVADGKGLATEGLQLAREGKKLIEGRKEQLDRILGRLEDATGAMESLAGRGETILKKNDAAIHSAITDLRDTAENLEVMTFYGKNLTRELAERPHRIIWGGRKPELPSEEQILTGEPPRQAR